MEGCVEGDSDGDEDGGEEDEDVPARLGHAVVTEHPLGALRHRRLVLGQRLDVGGRRAQQRLQARKKVFLSLNLMGLRKTCQYRVTMGGQRLHFVDFMFEVPQCCPTALQGERPNSKTVLSD